MVYGGIQWWGEVYGGIQWWGEVFLDGFSSVWFLLRDCREVYLSR